MTKAQRIWVLVASMVTLLVSILDNTIVTTTAVPIARELQPVDGASAVPWLLAAYAVAGTVVQPLYGKLADAFGVLPVYLTAVGIFVLGSLFCGAATGMPELIVFRALQGLGGGGLMSLTMVVIGHLRAEEESPAANQGNAMAAVLVGGGLVLGPLVGGVIVAHLGWRWIFLVNIPLGVAAFVVMAVCLRFARPAPPSRGSLELPSAGLLAVAGAAVLIACQWGGHQVGWGSWPVLLAGALAILSIVGFVRRQQSASEPFLPPRLLRQPILRVVTALQLATGLGMAAGIVYLALELQLIRGSSPVHTGLHLIPLALGLGIGSWIGSRLAGQGRLLRASIVLGAAMSAAALAGFACCGATTPILVLHSLMVLFGIGLGLGLGNEMLLIFAVVERRDIGMATTGIRFVESLGTSLGATLFATLFTALVPPGANLGQTARAIDIVFGIGAVLLAASAVIALRIPAGAKASPGPRNQREQDTIAV